MGTFMIDKVNNMLAVPGNYPKPLCQGIPYKRFHQKRWMVPVNEENIRYLQDTFEAENFSEAALNLIISYKQWGMDGKDQFKFSTQPYEKQKEAWEFIIGKRAAALFIEMGCGKTKIAIDDAVFQFSQSRIEAVAVLCPSSIRNTWIREIQIHSDTMNLAIHKHISTKKKLTESFINYPHSGLKWLIMGVETLSQGAGAELLLEFMVNNTSGLIIDESHTIKNPKSIRTKAVIKAGEMAVYRRILTGTPISKGIEDLYAQFYFLDPSIIGHSSYFTFRNRYCKMGGFKSKQITGYLDLDHLYNKLRPHTFKATKKECLDLPEKLYEVRTLTMKGEIKKLYDDMANELLIEIEQGMCEATTVVTKIVRCHQILGGFVSLAIMNEGNPTGKFKPHQIPGENPKIEELLEILQETDQKAIVWCRYEPEIFAVSEALSKAKINFINDRTDRDTVEERFQNNDKIRVFVGSPETMGLGITLTEATLVIYYSNSRYHIARTQSEDRAHRKGQRNAVTYIDILYEDSIDVTILKGLKDKKDLSESVMEALGDKISFNEAIQNMLRGGN